MSRRHFRVRVSRVVMTHALNDLATDGWALKETGVRTTKAVSELLMSIASSLGEIAPGRWGRLIEPVLPETLETARPGSLSSKFGLAPLPLHTDTAHWIVPCRYLLLACVEPGPGPTPTILLDSRAVELSESESLACRSAVFSVRNGRSSFYGSIMDRDRPFLRFDPGCMVPISEDGAMAMTAFSPGRNSNAMQRHDWKPGDIVTLDNWRMLHARGTETRPGRVLLRIMIR